MKDFFVNMLLLAEFSAIKLFFIYLIILFIMDGIFYTIEKLLGVPTIFRWYDAVLAFTLVGLYVYNISYLLEVLKSKLS